jgi:3-methyladenine DNA glycosylase AlkD
MEHPLIRNLRRELAAQADPKKAAGMQAYMKSSLPYYGVQTDPLRKIQREVFRAHPLPDFVSWRDIVLALWRSATKREERYAAIGLAAAAQYERFRTLRALPIYEEMITSGAWWDYVDGVAADLVGALLRRCPRTMKPTMLRWSVDEDLWKRRAAIICQLRFKETTDLDLMYRCILANAADRSFWIRKAIGWALRQHAWTDPAEVKRFVAAHEGELSPLSRREALKNVGSRPVT